MTAAKLLLFLRAAAALLGVEEDSEQIPSQRGQLRKLQKGGSCAGWCAKQSKPWEAKCGFDQCGGCKECRLKFNCAWWCEGNARPWSKKCGFKACDGCAKCCDYKNEVFDGKTCVTHDQLCPPMLDMPEFCHPPNVPPAGIVCPAGQGVKEGGCIDCGKGFYSAGGTDTPCKPCKLGKFAGGDKNVACDSCNDGSEVPPDVEGGLAGNQISSTNECVICPAGKTAVSGNPCSDCEVGSWATRPGMSACEDCPAGQAVNHEYGGLAFDTYYYHLYYDNDNKITKDEYMTMSWDDIDGGLREEAKIFPDNVDATFAFKDLNGDGFLTAEDLGEGVDKVTSTNAQGQDTTKKEIDICPSCEPAVNSSASCQACPLGTAPTRYGNAYTAAETGGAACLGCHVVQAGWRSNPDDTHCTFCPLGKYLPGELYQEPHMDHSSLCTDNCEISFPGQELSISELYNKCVAPSVSLSGDGRVATCELGSVPYIDESCVECDDPDTYAAAGDSQCLPCAEGYTTSGMSGQGGCHPIVDPAHVACDDTKVALPPVGDYTCVLRALWTGSNTFEDAKNVLQGWMTDCTTYWTVFPYDAFKAPLARLCTKFLGSTSSLAGQYVQWGHDDSTGLEFASKTLGQYNFNWAKILPTMAAGLISFDEVKESGEGFAAVVEEWSEGLKQSNGVKDGPGLVTKCSDPRKDSHSLCTSPIFAIFCPATCGYVPNPQTLCGAPTIKYSASQNFLATFDLSNPPLTPSLAKQGCEPKGVINYVTGHVEPGCA